MKKEDKIVIDKQIIHQWNKVNEQITNVTFDRKCNTLFVDRRFLSHRNLLTIMGSLPTGL